MIYKKTLKNHNSVYFATLDFKTKQMIGNNTNNEYVLKLNNIIVKPYFFVKDYGKIIEFDGDYWHGEARGNQQRDKNRDNELIANGYKILHVKERDYKNDSEKVITECLDFLKK